MKELIRMLFGSLTYLFVLLLALVLCEKLPNSLINRMIEKEEEYSIINLIQIPKLIFWCFCMITGFAFVNIIVLGNDFQDCLKSRHNRYFDLIITFIYIFFVFNFTANLVLYGQIDESVHECFKEMRKFNIERCMIRDITSNEMKSRVILKNFIFFCIPFVITLHYFHIRKIQVFSNMILTPKHIREWTTCQWILFFSSFIIITYLVLKQFNDYPKQFDKQIVFVYLSYILSVAFTITTVTMLLKKTHDVHLHHYFMGMFFMPLVSVQGELNLVILAHLFGLCIEGAAKWGLDPIWKEKKELPFD